MDLFRFREKHIPQTECGPSQRASRAEKCDMVCFNGLGTVHMTITSTNGGKSPLEEMD